MSRLQGVVLIGGGGHCRSVIDVIEAQGTLPIAGIVEQPGFGEEAILGHPVLGTDDDLPRLAREFSHALITVGQIRTSTVRQSLYRRCLELGFTMHTAISPLAHVSRHAAVGAGSVVMHFALVNAGAEVGANCILNTRALVEHDAVVGGHCHISTDAVLNGGARMGTGAFLGSGAHTREGVSIGSGCVVAMGESVLADVPDNTLLRGGKALRLGHSGG